MEVMSWLRLPEQGVEWLSTLFVCAIIVTLLWKNVPSFRYKFKFLIYMVQWQLCSLLIIPLALFNPQDPRNFHRFGGTTYIRQTSRLLGIKWEISGADLLADDLPCIVISNHQSALDLLLYAELMSLKKCFGIAKKSLMYVFPFGLMFWLCGTVFVNRSDSKESQAKMRSIGEKICEEKSKLWLCPEGTRSKKENLLPFKKGAFHMAVQQKLAIVPMVISPYTFVDDDKQIFDSGTVKVHVLDPIDTSNLQYPEDVSKLVETCYELMNLEFQKLKKEMHAK